MRNSKIIVIGLIVAVLSGIIISGFFIFADENAKVIIDSLLPGKTTIDSNLPGKTMIEPSPLFECGDNVTFTYKEETVTYGTVNSANTTCWMDRNLGASQVAVNATDTLAYGDLFQWGRLDDGHQTRTSTTTALEDTSDSDVPGHSNFIRTDVVPYDWRIPQNPNLWQPATNTNNPCPSGWSVPTETEWQTELDSWGYTSGNAILYAYASPLKLTMAGNRARSTGSLSSVGTGGRYWSSTVSGTNARVLYFSSTDAGMSSGNRALGFTVRCLKD